MLVQPSKACGYEISSSVPLRSRLEIQENPALMPVMLYDPGAQEIDETSRAIGENVCSLFCAYNETERIHAVLEEAAAAA